MAAQNPACAERRSSQVAAESDEQRNDMVSRSGLTTATKAAPSSPTAIGQRRRAPSSRESELARLSTVMWT